MRRILGIDPGFARLGISLVEVEKMNLIFAGIIETFAGEDWGKRLVKISDEMKEVLENYGNQIDEVVMERQFFNQNVTNSLRVSQAIGVVLAEIGRFNLPVTYLTPLQVKQTLVGYGRATKSQVKEEVRKTFNLKSAISPDDASDAAALSICRKFSANL